MACNCSKKKTPRPFGMGKGEPTKYVLKTRIGERTFSSRLEAEAAMRRAGGGSIRETR